MTANISDDADFLLSLVPFLDAHHVRTDRIEAIANRLRVMPTEEMIEGGARALAIADRKDPDAPAWVQGYGNREQTFGICWRDQYADKARDCYTAMQSTLLKEG